MIIDKIEIFLLNMPTSSTFKISSMDVNGNASLLVRMSSGGLDGWGESHAFQIPAFGPEYSAGQFHFAKTVVAPFLVGKDISSGEQLQTELNWIKGHQFTKAAFDLAFWDLKAHQEEKPLYSLLGGERTEIPVGADIGILQHPGELVDAVGAATDARFKRIKIKVGRNWHVNVIEPVRKHYPDQVIHVDCNSAFTLEDMDVLNGLDQFDLAMIEQPLMFDDLLDHSKLQGSIETPICLDESIVSEQKARKAIEMRSGRWVNIKLGRVGGLTPAMKILSLCEASGIPCWVGGMLESAIGQTHSLSFASLSNIHYPSDIFPTDRFYNQDLTAEPMELSQPSTLSLNKDAHGIGLVPDPARLADFTASHDSFTA